VTSWGSRVLAPLVLLAALVVSGCGGSDGTGGIKPPKGTSQSEFERQLAEAASVRASDFPAVQGRTLQQLADTARAGPRVGLATSVLVPGTNRLAFGVIDTDKGFVYGKSAVYVAPSPGSRAKGPFPAPADSLITKPAFRSRTAASEGDTIASIYAAQVPFARAGRYAVLVLTKTRTGVLGAATQVTVRRDTPIPDVGERPPAVETDTLATVNGDKALLDTRLPPAPALHETSFKDVVGRKPVVLLFATPRLCQSRVCGPVVDIALQLQSKYGDQAQFIHQEVYVDNQLDKGLRPPLRAFGLSTEPWLFTVDRSGRVAARMEGSFGQRAFENAVQKALR
jgi:hypothetical protein